MILLIDNYDSFVHNLARYFQRLGLPTEVVRNDAVDVATIRASRPQAVVLSPGPCTPAEAGCSVEIVRHLNREVPILGICLGHQAIAAAFGGRVVRARQPMHGRTSEVHHLPSPLFEGQPKKFSRAGSPLPYELHVTAMCDDGTIMAIEHVNFPVFGLQFHPEAILTEHGYRIMANFLKLAGCKSRSDLAELTASERPAPVIAEPVAPRQPVTF